MITGQRQERVGVADASLESDVSRAGSAIVLPTLIPHRGALPPVQRVELLGEGDFCVCYLVNGDHVFRLAKHPAASSALRREVNLLPDVDAWVDVQVPRILADGDRADTGEHFVVYPLIQGTLLAPDVLRELAPHHSGALIRQLAAFTKRLHAFPVSRARECGLEQIDSRQHLAAAMRRGERDIKPRVEPAVWRYYERLLERYLSTPELNEYSPSLLHGDLSPGHVLASLERFELTGIIDFGDCCLGDPHWDLVYVLEDYGVDALEAFLASYAPRGRHVSGIRVHLLQRLNNVVYCLLKMAADDRPAAEEAIATLIAQAAAD